MLPGGTHVSEVDRSGRRQPFFRSVAQIGRQAAQGLAYAHARGVVHRDIKPSNLLLDTAGVVWITDFGLAKADDDDLTATGDILGTLRYMAPERFRGEGDARADIYALGLTLYELLTLRPAYESADRLKLIERIKGEEPARPRSRDDRIPRDLETIVLKAIDKDPERRYPSADAMAEDLRRFLADEPIRARQVGSAERYLRWARRNKVIAVMGGVLLTVLVLAPVGSLIVAGRMAYLAENAHRAAIAERSARQEASRQAKAEATARGEADQARTAAQAETYRALLSEVKALRAGRQPGWRDEALANLARLAVLPTPRRDLLELRAEATACMRTPDIHLVARLELPWDNRGLAFIPDGQTLVTAGYPTGLEFWDVRRLQHLSSVAGSTLTRLATDTVVYIAPLEGLAVATDDHGVVFTDAHGIRLPKAPITRGTSKPTRLAVDAKGQRIAVGWTGSSGITVHDAAGGSLLERFDASPFALSPDGRWLARAELADVVLHPIGRAEPKVVLGHHDGVLAFDFSPDGAIHNGVRARSTSVPTVPCSPPTAWTTPCSGTWRSGSSTPSAVTPKVPKTSRSVRRAIGSPRRKATV